MNYSFSKFADGVDLNDTTNSINLILISRSSVLKSIKRTSPFDSRTLFFFYLRSMENYSLFGGPNEKFCYD